VNPNPPYPHALPCPDVYDLYPNAIGPTANVVVTNLAEVQKWKLVARRISAEEAEANGGCLAFLPSGDASPNATPQYFCLTDSDDVVNELVSYIPDGTAPEKVKQLEPALPVNGRVADSADESKELTTRESPMASSLLDLTERG
jgi:hypothetical protein